MKPIKFILIHEAGSENAARAISGCHLPDIRHHHIIKCSPLKLETSNGEQRRGLLDELARLRRHHPEAKILGICELGDYRVHPSEGMNELRRELSVLTDARILDG